MIDFPLIFLGGLLGSSHCLGMCGGFAIAVGSKAANWRANLLRQFTYGAGRLFTYMSIGAAAGYGGRKLVAAVDLFNVQAVLAILAGTLLISQGLRATGFTAMVANRLRRSPRAVAGRTSADSQLKTARPAGFKLPHCLSPGLLGSMLRRSDLAGPLLAGVVTGFVPCGLVYAMSALAVSSGDLITGLLTMACFGAGTFPLMITFGLGTSLVGLRARRRMFQFAAWSVVITGALSVGRGVYAINVERAEPSKSTLPPCPFCRTAA